MQNTQDKRQFIVENEQRCTDVWLMAHTVSTCISRSFPDASPDAPLDASLHSTIHTFRHCLAAWRCFVAATGSPFSGSPPLLAAWPGGTTVARYVTYSAGHSHLMVLPFLK